MLEEPTSGVRLVGVRAESGVVGEIGTSEGASIYPPPTAPTVDPAGAISGIRWVWSEFGLRAGERRALTKGVTSNSDSRRCNVGARPRGYLTETRSWPYSDIRVSSLEERRLGKSCRIENFEIRFDFGGCRDMNRTSSR